jgi:hypothetical protein
MPGIDKPTGRVVVLIMLLIVVAAALHGYLPAHEAASRTEPGNGRAALTFIIAALTGTTALLAIAVIARLRDPRTAAPSAGDPSELLRGSRERPHWRVLLIAIGLIVAWLVIALLLSRLFVPPVITGSAPTPEPATPPSTPPTTAPPKESPQNNNGDVLGILLASAVPLMLIVIAGAVINTRKRPRWTTPVAVDDDHPDSSPPPTHSETLVRAAELGLAEMADPSRDPRDAIIACYAAMERELANVPGAVPQDFDTPTEVLARAVEHHALHADSAVQLVNLFEEARFSPHVMGEEHREVAVRVLRLVLDELAPQSRRSGV